eukprot:TRINITY_DN6078_c0_g1_i1.p1 TRINITY_DN6078_c0_g1~~TRINITY_DN6078_c0_g1_i1.p1  ORF type:complete len:704 (-),score=116.49 TRINITY_DN6078_c0_g1_i1:40-2151(-)
MFAGEIVTQFSTNTVHCEICYENFGYWTNRPHHCRKCGLCVCHSCSPYFIPVSPTDTHAVRICSNCLQRLKEGNDDISISRIMAPSVRPNPYRNISGGYDLMYSITASVLGGFTSSMKNILVGPEVEALEISDIKYGEWKELCTNCLHLLSNGFFFRGDIRVITPTTHVLEEVDHKTNFFDVVLLFARSCKALSDITRLNDNKSIEIATACVGSLRDSLRRIFSELYESIVKHENEQLIGEPIVNICNEICLLFEESVKLYGKKTQDNEAEKNFQKQFQNRLASITPELVVHQFTDSNYFIEEYAEKIPLNHGIELLKVEAPDYVRHISRYNFRPSVTKSFPEAQGMSVNLWKHSIEVEGVKVASFLRSGAFSTHHTSTRGLSHLLTLYDSPDGAIKAAGFVNKAAMEREIPLRISLLASQALPKIIESINLSLANENCRSALRRTRRFLHCEISLLSDYENLLGGLSEKSMIEDMYGIMTYLRRNLFIRFLNHESSVLIERGRNGQIVINMLRPLWLDDTNDLYGVELIFLSQGVNEFQSISNLKSMWNESSLQEPINTEGIRRILEYAKKIKDVLPTGSKIMVTKLANHFSEATYRPAKDLEGLDAIISLIPMLFGQIGIVCKSGKDRTGAFVTRSILKSLQKKQYLLDYDNVSKKIHGGVSYSITGYNTGIKSYAFNKLQTLTMPNGFAPDDQYCGSNVS